MQSVLAHLVVLGLAISIAGLKMLGVLGLKCHGALEDSIVFLHVLRGYLRIQEDFDWGRSLEESRREPHEALRSGLQMLQQTLLERLPEQVVVVEREPWARTFCPTCLESVRWKGTLARMMNWVKMKKGPLLIAELPNMFDGCVGAWPHAQTRERRGGIAVEVQYQDPRVADGKTDSLAIPVWRSDFVLMGGGASLQGEGVCNLDT